MPKEQLLWHNIIKTTRKKKYVLILLLKATIAYAIIR
nr:MAG TPA: hypothetical protein [Caudoviricetes sp.]